MSVAAKKTSGAQLLAERNQGQGAAALTHTQISHSPNRLTAVPLAAVKPQTLSPQTTRPRAACPQRTSAPLRPSRSPEQLVRTAIETKLSQGARLSAVEEHLFKNINSLNRKLFAPSFSLTGKSLATSLARPALVLGFLVGVTILPEKSTFAVFPETLSTADHLASALIVDHSHSRSLPSIKETSIQLTASPSTHSVSAIDEVRLPLLREMGVEPPPAPTRSQPPAVKVAAVVARENVVPAVKTAAIPAERRSLVKFISGLIAAFRPELPDSSHIARHIVELSASERVDPLYIAAVIAIESRFSSTARSGVGATGLMQLMPMTAGEVAERYKLSNHARRLTDPRMNIRLGIRYLKELEQRYRGNRFLALSAYNWGPGNVDQTRGKDKNIPGSVRKYSQTILDRTNNWRRHFARANENAELLADASAPLPANEKLT